MTISGSDRDRRPAAPLRVLVLTCEGLGFESARALEGIAGIEVIGVVTSPHRRLPLRRRLRRIRRTHGVVGLARLAARRLNPLRRVARGTAEQLPACPVIHVDDLHSAEALQRIRELAPDLGIVDGTYILEPSVFTLPRLGSINIHCGRVPEYRGSPPAFWEIYDGTPSVGVTIHQVTEGVDEGPVLMQGEFAVDIAPAGDPLSYVHGYWREVLRPNALQMLRATVVGFRDGTVVATAQPRSDIPTRRTPSREQVNELKRRVRARRVGSAAS